MIDGLYKKHIDHLWEAASTPLIRAGLTPNQVTSLGMVLTSLAAFAFLWHTSAVIFGITLGLAFMFDALDGAVARRRNMRSKRGGYFDAIVGRYQELVVIGVLAHFYDLWPLGLAAFSGSALISYAKARTAIETEINNDDWPDLFERMERVIFLSVMLILAGILGPWVITWGLTLFAGLAHFTALQRARRAAQMLQKLDEDEASGS